MKSKHTPPYKLPTISPVLKTHIQFLYVSMANTLKIRSQLYYSVFNCFLHCHWKLGTAVNVCLHSIGIYGDDYKMTSQLLLTPVSSNTIPQETVLQEPWVPFAHHLT